MFLRARGVSISPGKPPQPWRSQQPQPGSRTHGLQTFSHSSGQRFTTFIARCSKVVWPDGGVGGSDGGCGLIWWFASARWWWALVRASRVKGWCSGWWVCETQCRWWLVGTLSDDNWFLLRMTPRSITSLLTLLYVVSLGYFHATPVCVWRNTATSLFWSLWAN